METIVIKTFSATKSEDRNWLGDTATRWLHEHADSFELSEPPRVLQSSDSQFHCLSIVLIGVAK